MRCHFGIDCWSESQAVEHCTLHYIHQACPCFSVQDSLPLQCVVGLSQAMPRHTYRSFLHCLWIHMVQHGPRNATAPS
jgi:hypothetical protein